MLDFFLTNVVHFDWLIDFHFSPLMSHLKTQIDQNTRRPIEGGFIAPESELCDALKERENQLSSKDTQDYLWARKEQNDSGEKRLQTTACTS